jgi:exonuclease SbcC
MRPLRLRLDSFGCYRQPAEVDFSDVGFFALTGPTGSGKSTLIDGLCFALYGTVPRWGSQNAIADALAPAAAGGRVCLVFESAGKRYAAVRALARDKRGQVHTREARLDRLDPKVPPDAPLAEILEHSIDQLAEGPDEVKTQVQDILGLTYEHFTQSVLLPQGRFSDFLQAEPRKRQDLLVELLAFGVYEQVGQQARRHADLAAERIRAAGQQRDELAGATQDAEARTAARVAELAEVERVAEGKLASLGELAERASQAAGQARAVQDEASLLARVSVPGEVAGLAERIARADTLLADRTDRAAAAERAEAQAEEARAALPDARQMEQARAAYLRQRELAGQLDRQQQELAGRQEAEQARAREAETADAEAARAHAELTAARHAHAAYALAKGLQAGQDCPVCRQPVAVLPDHAPPPALERAEAAAAAADARLPGARTALNQASAAAAAASTTAEATRRQLDAVTAELGGAPAEPEVTTALDAIGAADKALDEARAGARSARRDRDAAAGGRAALTAEEERAWTGLRRARDSVVALGAPPADERDLAAAWAALAGWASEQQADRRERLPALAASAAELENQAAASAAGLIALLAEHGVGDITDPAQGPRALAAHRARAQQQLTEIRRDLDRAARLDQQIRNSEEEQQVAAELGRLLRANSFERWLVAEALDSLVAEASATLAELSGGQYLLDRDDRNDLVVIDNSDAGARRPVHTLSGGESFQASLALALALSRQVIGLSAGMRDLDSVFLDEGFGTLDPETLDTVASTLERLAAAGDRMVGLVTHVAALADRVPVRFVISRDAVTSAVRREQ